MIEFFIDWIPARRPERQTLLLSACYLILICMAFEDYQTKTVRRDRLHW